MDYWQVLEAQQRTYSIPAKRQRSDGRLDTVHVQRLTHAHARHVHVAVCQIRPTHYTTDTHCLPAPANPATPNNSAVTRPTQLALTMQHTNSYRCRRQKVRW